MTSARGSGGSRGTSSSDHFRSTSRRDRAIGRFRDEVARVVQGRPRPRRRGGHRRVDRGPARCIARLPEKLRRVVRAGLDGGSPPTWPTSSSPPWGPSTPCTTAPTSGSATASGRNWSDGPRPARPDGCLVQRRRDSPAPARRAGRPAPGDEAFPAGIRGRDPADGDAQGGPVARVALASPRRRTGLERRPRRSIGRSKTGSPGGSTPPGTSSPRRSGLAAGSANGWRGPRVWRRRARRRGPGDPPLVGRSGPGPPRSRGWWRPPGRTLGSDTLTGLAMAVKLDAVRWTLPGEPHPIEGDVLASRSVPVQRGQGADLDADRSGPGHRGAGRLRAGHRRQDLLPPGAGPRSGSCRGRGVPGARPERGDRRPRDRVWRQRRARWDDARADLSREAGGGAAQRVGHSAADVLPRRRPRWRVAGLRGRLTGAADRGGRRLGRLRRGVEPGRPAAPPGRNLPRRGPGGRALGVLAVRVAARRDGPQRGRGAAVAPDLRRDPAGRRPWSEPLRRVPGRRPWAVSGDGRAVAAPPGTRALPSSSGCSAKQSRTPRSSG